MISLSVLTPSIPCRGFFGSRPALGQTHRLASLHLCFRRVAVGTSARQHPTRVRTSRFLRLWSEPCQYAPDSARASPEPDWLEPNQLRAFLKRDDVRLRTVR